MSDPLPLAVAHAGATGRRVRPPQRRQDALTITPARVAAGDEAVGRDLYDSTNTQRDVLVLAAALAHGDSGAPLVNRAARSSAWPSPSPPTSPAPPTP